MYYICTMMYYVHKISNKAINVFPCINFLLTKINVDSSIATVLAWIKHLIVVMQYMLLFATKSYFAIKNRPKVSSISIFVGNKFPSSTI